MNNIAITRNCFNAFTGTGGGGVPYFPGCVGHRILMHLDISIAWNLKEAKLQFTSATKVIAMLNPYDPRRFDLQGFKAGDTITVVGSVSNNGNLTIASMGDNGLSITVVEALVDEVDESASIHGVTAVTALDLFSNLIPNRAQESYLSLTDPLSIQKYTVDGISASDLVTVTNMKVATKSLAWVTNVITDTVTKATNEVTVVGMGITNYAQKFRIAQRIITTPLNLVSQYYNFANIEAPDYFAAGSALRHVCSVSAKYDTDSPEGDQTGSLTTPNGTGSWFNSGKRDTAPLYQVTSVTYTESGTANVLGRLDVDKNVNVTVVLNSLTGVFAGGGGTTGTKFEVGFFAHPSTEADYQQTPTTLVQNFFRDQARPITGGASVSGEMAGTAYGLLSGVTATLNSANQVTIAFTWSAGSALDTFWRSKVDGDRYYSLYVITQNIALTTTKAADLTPLLLDFQSADWDKTDANLFNFSGSGMYAYEYPNTGTVGVGTIEGYAGDPWFIQIPFRVDKQSSGGLTPTVQSISFQVLAKKTNKDDFILEERVIDCSQMKKLAGIQQLIADQTRGFITYENDPRNYVTLERDAAHDTLTMAGYIASYGLVLRYEDWITAANQPGNRNDGTIPDIALDIEALTHDWSSYSGVSGWALCFRFRITIQGTDGNNNQYYSDMPMEVIGSDNVTWAGGSGTLTQDLQYFEYDATGAGLNGGWAGEELKCLQQEAQTLVRSTYTGDFVLPVTATGWYVWLSINAPTGSIFDRRFGSSEIDSEDDSPMSDPGADPLAAISYCFGNVRINIYPGEKITAETLVDSTMWGLNLENLFVLQRLGAKYIST